MTAALDGMRILDMTQYEAGTSGTQMLAWLGADVVKIESPRGDPGRKVFGSAGDSQYFLNYNSNKRSVVIDLQQPEGRELFLQLVPKFDVFVENYGPGVMERLDLGYDVLRELKPEIIYARIKGYGLDGPYAGYKCFDPLAQATAGAIAVTGRGDVPVKPGPTIADTGTGMQTALAVTAAWAQRLQSGKGQFIEVSMQEAMLMFMRTVGVNHWGERPMPRGSHKPLPPSGTFPCAPEHPEDLEPSQERGPNDYLHITSGTSRMWDAICLTIGREDLLTDPRFASGRDRAKNADALDVEVTAWTKQHTKTEAMQILCDAGVPAGAVFDQIEVINNPHLQARGFIHELEHPHQGPVTLMGSPIRMSESQVPLEVAPVLGASTAEVLGEELGLDQDAISGLAEAGVVRLEPGAEFEASVEIS